jgi:hypothetical protein
MTQGQRFVVTEIASGDTDVVTGVEFLAFTDVVVNAELIT